MSENFSYAYYPYYVYIESDRSKKEKSIALQNNSQYFDLQHGSPCIVTITGACVNPYWELFQDGQIISTDGFIIELADNQKLIVSSYPESQYARVYNPDGSYADVSQFQDFTRSNFVKIPTGSSTAIFYVDNSAAVSLVYKEERMLV
ncbi:hypothetical protein ATX69_09600 [Oenococcus oeni]|uniref:hypothetical protein n=1 Tax=Oenococcus oeni TaxID=1247 RepID=UPI0008F8E6EB|nr:hypothetical protein [Oenococcus oeni]OIK78658.1 hypothetical protein ATW73_09540 [Oenococcus oeni]OIM32239.1 hypothetical protein ATX69_09600 [Oenococcus oeni]